MIGLLHLDQDVDVVEGEAELEQQIGEGDRPDDGMADRPKEDLDGPAPAERQRLSRVSFSDMARA